MLALAIAYRYPYELILGPALIIILAAVLMLITRFPSAKSKAGAFLVFVGLFEAVGTLSVAFLWGFMFSIFTLTIGVVLSVSKVKWNGSILSKPALVAIMILVGAVGLGAAIAYSVFILFIVGLAGLIGGLVLGAIQLAMRIKNPAHKMEIDAAVIFVAVVVTVLVTPLAFAWGLIFGLSILATGILFGVAAFYPWIKTRLNANRPRRLKKAFYIFLAAAIVISSSVIILRTATNLIHEQWLEKGPSGVTPNLTIRGDVVSVARDVEVNTGYSYHIFPAIITLDYMELVSKSESLPTPIVPDQLLIGGRITVYFEGTDISPLIVGERVEAKGYFNGWIEDSLYSGKFVVGPQIIGSYIQAPSPSPTTENLACNAVLTNVRYLTLPSLPTADKQESRLFLVSTIASYGLHDGQECFIIKATLRNDYSAEQQPPDSFNGGHQAGTAYFILHATLYDDGERVDTTEITEPHTMPVPGSPQHVLEPGETGLVEMDMATSNRSIDTYKIELVAVGGIPIP